MADIISLPPNMRCNSDRAADVGVKGARAIDKSTQGEREREPCGEGRDPLAEGLRVGAFKAVPLFNKLCAELCAGLPLGLRTGCCTLNDVSKRNVTQSSVRKQHT